MTITERKFYQEHRQGNDWARITIEWSNGCTVYRNDQAEEVAEAIFAKAAPKVRDIVNALRGNSK